MAKESGLIQGSVDRELKDQFDKWLEDNQFKVSRAVESMTKLWLSLPQEIQAQLYSGSLSKDSFVKLMREIAKEEFAKLHKSQRK